jgi:hypothetical protein
MITAAALALFLSACAQQPAKKNTDDEDLASALSSIFGNTIKPDMKEVEKHPLGSAKNPVRVSMPIGQQEYLSRLVCENGEPVSAFSRDGSVGTGPYGSIMDRYTVICDTNQGAVEHSVYMDMYHPDNTETRPAAGFKALKPRE